ncbi:ATP-dependent 6-phosphofructokinase 2 [Linum perenne]
MTAVRAAIVTCGGLCPGMNTVIREVVFGLWELYGVCQIYGVSAGYRGFYDREPVKLDPKLVHNLHKKGGTVLETSRGGFDLEKIVDDIERHGFNQELVTALIERWRPETNTFHLVPGEATITLEDVEVLTGLPTTGRSLIVSPDEQPVPEICEQWLGVQPPANAI